MPARRRVGEMAVGPSGGQFPTKSPGSSDGPGPRIVTPGPISRDKAGPNGGGPVLTLRAIHAPMAAKAAEALRVKTVDKSQPDDIVAVDDSPRMEHEANGAEFWALDTRAGPLAPDRSVNERWR